MSEQYVALSAIKNQLKAQVTAQNISKQAEIDILAALPIDDVCPVTRCKNCLHQDKGQNASESWNYCKLYSRDIYDNFFCASAAERRKYGA